MKRQSWDREKIFAKHVSDKGLEYKIYKELLQFKKKANDPILKYGQKTGTETSSKKTYRWLMSPWKKYSTHFH